MLSNGRVIVRESSLGNRIHVGNTGRRIRAVPETVLNGNDVIDVPGMSAARGFIDLHSQSVR